MFKDHLDLANNTMLFEGMERVCSNDDSGVHPLSLIIIILLSLLDYRHAALPDFFFERNNYDEFNIVIKARNHNG